MSGAGSQPFSGGYSLAVPQTMTIVTEEAIVSRLVGKAISSVGRGETKLFDITDAIKAEAEAIVAEGTADGVLVNELVLSSKPFVAALLSGGVTEGDILTHLHSIFPGREDTLMKMKSDPRYVRYFEVNSFINICYRSLKQPAQLPLQLPPSPPSQKQQLQHHQQLTQSQPSPPSPPSPPLKRTLVKYESECDFKLYIKVGDIVSMRRKSYCNGAMEENGYELFNPKEPGLRYPVFLNFDSEPSVKHEYIAVTITRVGRMISQKALNRYCVIMGDPFYIVTGKAGKM